MSHTDPTSTTPTLTAREPAVVIGAVTTVVAAIMTLAVAFGLDLTSDQQAAVLGVVAAVGPIVAAILTRARVSPAP